MTADERQHEIKRLCMAIPLWKNCWANDDELFRRYQFERAALHMVQQSELPLFTPVLIEWFDRQRGGNADVAWPRMTRIIGSLRDAGLVLQARSGILAWLKTQIPDASKVVVQSQIRAANRALSELSRQLSVVSKSEAARLRREVERRKQVADRARERFRRRTGRVGSGKDRALAEFSAVAQGLVTMAEACGQLAQFFTLVLGKKHLAAGEVLTTQQGIVNLTHFCSLLRARDAKIKAGIRYALVIEPHKDGSPHLHGIIVADSVAVAQRLLRQVAAKLAIRCCIKPVYSVSGLASYLKKSRRCLEGRAWLWANGVRQIRYSQIPYLKLWRAIRVSRARHWGPGNDLRRLVFSGDYARFAEEAKRKNARLVRASQHLELWLGATQYIRLARLVAR